MNYNSLTVNHLFFRCGFLLHMECNNSLKSECIKTERLDIRPQASDTRMCRLDVSDHGRSERRRRMNVYKRSIVIHLLS